jgi:dihydrofolate reductase
VTGLIDEYLLAISPTVLCDGPRLFDGLSAELALELVDARVFDAGCVLARYRVAQKGGEVGGAARDLRGSHELGPLR